MPSYGGAVRSSRSWLGGRAMATAGVGVFAAGLLVCALVLAHGTLTPTDELATGNSGASLASMQKEVQHQLVEAAKRHAMAEKHKMESVKLANAAQKEREQAALLKKRAMLARSEAELEHAGDEVRSAHSKVNALRDQAEKLLATVKADRNEANSDREKVMELEDKAGALSQKASEEQDKIKLVEAKQNSAAAALPKLLKDAEDEEVEASEMKAQARKRMADSELKAAAAKRLDMLAEQKEQDAHMMRNKLMGLLERKTHVLSLQEKRAARADELAKEAARLASDKAQKYAAEAAERAELAKGKISDGSEEDGSNDGVGRESQAAAPKISKAAPAPAPAPETHEEKERDARLAKMEADAEAADAADDEDNTKAKVVVVKAPLQALHVVAPRDPEAKAEQLSREEVHAARAKNLMRAGLEAERRAAAVGGREQELASEAPKARMEDGHYSQREQVFKRALAAAYRAGYDGEARQAELRAETTAKPARMQMLGDIAPVAAGGIFASSPNELLSAGDGADVQLEKEGARQTSEGGSGPMMTMLWTDPGSLKADTRDLLGTTSRMHRYTPHGGPSASALPNMATLYETGHASREENAFKKDMGKYRTALKEEREAHEEKVKRLDQELAQLPAAGRSTGNWKQDRESAFSTMLHQPQNQWDTHGEHAYSHTQQQALLAMPSVHEDEEGHLVFSRRRNARMQELHEYAHRRRYGRSDRGRGRDRDGDDGETLGVHADTVRRVKEELARERRRDRRLEDVTQRLQGEIDELREERSNGARTQDLVQMRREREDHEMRRRRIEDDRRQRIEGARGRMRRYHSRAHGEGGSPTKFHPDSTYNQEYASDPGHVSVGEIKFQHALKDFDRTKSILREGAQQDEEHLRMPQLVPSHLPGQGLR